MATSVLDMLGSAASEIFQQHCIPLLKRSPIAFDNWNVETVRTAIDDSYECAITLMVAHQPHYFTFPLATGHAIAAINREPRYGLYEYIGRNMVDRVKSIIEQFERPMLQHRKNPRTENDTLAELFYLVCDSIREGDLELAYERLLEAAPALQGARNNEPLDGRTIGLVDRYEESWAERDRLAISKPGHNVKITGL